MNFPVNCNQVLSVILRHCLFCTVSFILISFQVSRAWAGINLTTLLAFNNTNGAYPYCPLLQATDGFFYGTALNGGSYFTNGGGYGTAYKISSSGTLTWTVSFNKTNGENPYSGLIQGSDGNLYGTTDYGGTNGGYGTIFRIDSSGLIASIFSFSGGSSGDYPNGGLIQTSDGNLYGTTYYGGVNGRGTVFRLTTNGLFAVLYSFSSILDLDGHALDGEGPFAGLVDGKDGNLYGTTQFGGPYTDSHGNTLGTVFKISTNGALATLHSFTGNLDGGKPTCRLLLGVDGYLYGTTQTGKTNPGSVFRISRNGAFDVLHAFSIGGSEGYAANSLIQGTDGNFYGTTESGGDHGVGTIFRVTPSGALTTLYSFGSKTSPQFNFLDGASPFAGVTQGSDGNLYGTTFAGGPPSGVEWGTLFKISVPMAAVIQPLTQTQGILRLTWTSVSGQNYKVQFKTNSLETNWTDLGSTNVATNGTMSAFDGIGSNLQRFYKVVLLP